MNSQFRTVVVAWSLLAASPAMAYIGPGAGISFVGSLFTWLIGIVIALFAILFFPVRILIRRLRGKSAGSRSEGDEPTESDSASSDPGQ